MNASEFREWVEQWARAYPEDVFPKPDMKRAYEVLKAEGLSLDCISAANMRHVITRVAEELRKVPAESETLCTGCSSVDCCCDQL